MIGRVSTRGDAAPELAGERASPSAQHRRRKRGAPAAVLAAKHLNRADTAWARMPDARPLHGPANLARILRSLVAKPLEPVATRGPEPDGIRTVPRQRRGTGGCWPKDARPTRKGTVSVPPSTRARKTHVTSWASGPARTACGSSSARSSSTARRTREAMPSGATAVSRPGTSQSSSQRVASEACGS